MALDNESLASILADYVPKAEYESTLEALNALAEERDELAAERTKSAGRVSELEKAVRSRSYKDSYDRMAKELKIKDEFKDDVYRLAGVEEDADEPDEKGLRRHFEKFLESKKHYTQQEPERPKSIPAGEGHGRGRSVSPGEPEFRVTRAQRNDASWMRQNQAAFQAASKAGAVIFDD
jgi:hypothetical protein